MSGNRYSGSRVVDQKDCKTCNRSIPINDKESDDIVLCGHCAHDFAMMAPETANGILGGDSRDER